MTENIDQSLKNVRDGCCCPNGGRPVDGLIYISPCCHVHWAVLRLTAADVGKKNVKPTSPKRKVKGEQPARMFVRKQKEA